MSDVRFDYYYRYDDITDLLRKLEDEYPSLVDISSIGKSYEGRDIWVATVTNKETGPASEKPAMLIDGNIHASEVIASMVALRHLVTLVGDYSRDKEVTRCLDSRAFYIIPRVNPDGAELALADQPRFVRSSTRPYPFDEDPTEGLCAEDVDGDGRILNMRVPDPNGRWKKSDKDPRIMVERDPAEVGGDYYKIYTEGRIPNYDGVTVMPVHAKEGLDLNRNFPSNWAREHKQQGAGPFPLSEPETHALASFVSQHPNIFSWIAGHSFSGVLLRAGYTERDDQLPIKDLWHYKMVGEKGTEATGYPAISVYEDFRYGVMEMYGSLGWAWENFGIYLWSPEYWAPHRNAGVKPKHYAQWIFHHDDKDHEKIIAYSDKELDGEGYVDWYEFDHPDLGPVEIGGWNLLRFLYNPPASQIDKESAPFSAWFTWQLLMSPKLELRESNVEKLEDDTSLVRVVVQNTGYLPSYGSDRALEQKVVRGVVAEIELPEGAELVQGKVRDVFGQLDGRSGKSGIVLGSFLSDSTADRLKLEWVVRGAKGREVEITVRHERAGTVRKSFQL